MPLFFSPCIHGITALFTRKAGEKCTEALYAVQDKNRTARKIPRLGTNYSQAGNKLFPRWEQIIPSVGIKHSHAGNFSGGVRGERGHLACGGSQARCMRSRSIIGDATMSHYSRTDVIVLNLRNFILEMM
jgi:hypothetical protein